MMLSCLMSPIRSTDSICPLSLSSVLTAMVRTDCSLSDWYNRKPLKISFGYWRTSNLLWKTWNPKYCWPISVRRYPLRLRKCLLIPNISTVVGMSSTTLRRRFPHLSVQTRYWSSRFAICLWWKTRINSRVHSHKYGTAIYCLTNWKLTSRRYMLIKRNGLDATICRYSLRECLPMRG